MHDYHTIFKIQFPLFQEAHPIWAKAYEVISVERSGSLMNRNLAKGVRFTSILKLNLLHMILLHSECCMSLLFYRVYISFISSAFCKTVKESSRVVCDIHHRHLYIFPHIM